MLNVQAKLSKLQKWILLAAYDKIENPQSPKTNEHPPREITIFISGHWYCIDPETASQKMKKWRKRRGPEAKLTRHEVLMRYFGFAERGPRRCSRFPIIDRRGRLAAFNAASASLSRALQRLRARGLIGWYDIELRAEGIEVAKELKRNG